MPASPPPLRAAATASSSHPPRPLPRPAGRGSSCPTRTGKHPRAAAPPPCSSSPPPTAGLSVIPTIPAEVPGFTSRVSCHSPPRSSPDARAPMAERHGPAAQTPNSNPARATRAPTPPRRFELETSRVPPRLDRPDIVDVPSGTRSADMGIWVRSDERALMRLSKSHRAQPGSSVPAGLHLHCLLLLLPCNIPSPFRGSSPLPQKSKIVMGSRGLSFRREFSWGRKWLNGQQRVVCTMSRFDGRTLWYVEIHCYLS